MFKTFIKLILGLVIFAVIVVVGVVLLVDANQYRPALEKAVADATGFELSIAGNLELDLFPNMALTLNDVRLKNPAYPQELASTTAVSLRIDPSALTSGRLQIKEFIANDFHINYTIDESGKNNWTVEGNESHPPQSASQENGGSNVSATFERISISNASIDIQDLAAGARYSLDNVDVESSYSNIDGVPFPVDIQLDYVTYSESTGLAEPVSMGLRSIVSADLDQGIIDISEFNFNVTPLLLQGQVSIEGLNDSIKATGSLEANPFDVAGLMQTLSGTQDSSAAITSRSELPRLSFDLDFTGDESQFSISQLNVRLGDSTAAGNVDIRLATEFTPMNVSYNLTSSAIDLNPFLASAEASETNTQANQSDSSTEGSSAAATATPLPVDLLSSFDVIGSLSIDSLIADDYLIEDINIFTNVESSVLDIEIQPMKAFDGTIAGTVRIDGRTPEALMASQLNFNQLNLVDLAPSVSRFNSVTGRLNVVSDYTASAATTQSLVSSLEGSTQFAISDNSVDIGVIKQIFTTIAALSPRGGSIQEWPDQIQFNQLGGFIVFDNGIADNQVVNLKMDNFQLDGVGGIDLDAGSFNYQLAFTLLGEPELQTIPIDDLYHGVEWPVECAAAFADDISQYCRPDFTRVREIFTRLGANALRNELEETITDQVPENLRDAARGLLNNILN